MHLIQRKILSFADKINLKRDGLRQIARLVGESHPFKISYHLKKLEEKGLIRVDWKTGEIKNTDYDKTPRGSFVAIPVLGEANCGNATIFADENLEGYIKVSKKIISSDKNVIAIKAFGNSMNKAKIANKSFEDGDYVIVDCNKVAKNGDYVLAIIDECATLKRLFVDSKNKVLSLIPESTENHPNIFIHENDKFLIKGVVVNIIKKPIIN